MCNTTYKENKKETPEDFIGWKSEDGKLKVVGIIGKDKWGVNKYKVTCEVCSLDTELFPEGYFVCSKGELKRGRKPCGCAKSPRWDSRQFLVIVKRLGNVKGFLVHGFAEKFHGNKTKLNLECMKDGHKWLSSINNITSGNGCIKCSKLYRLTEQEALEKCKIRCKELNYVVAGFPNEYKNAYSRFEYECPVHGIQNVSYNNFINHKKKCGRCWRDRQKESGNLYGYYPERGNEQDFLYVLNFNDQYIKVGRSFDFNKRMRELRILSNIENVYKLRIYNATHLNVYSLEQDLHNKLTKLGFYHHESTWSTETFSIDCLPELYKLLDNCGLERLL